MAGRNYSAATGVKDLGYLARVLPLIDPAARRLIPQAQLATAQTVASRAQAAAAGEGPAAALAATTLKARGSALGATITAGSAAVPWWAGTEFGAAHDSPRLRSTGIYLGLNQFPAPHSNDGRWLLPTVRDSRQLILDNLTAVLEQAAAIVYAE